MDNPTPEQIKNTRTELSLTQRQAAELVHSALRTWQQWEKGDRKMHQAFWELFQIKVKKQHKNN